MLAHQHGTKQIIVVTDGEPTAHIEPDGEVLFNYPPIPETLRRTMAEVVRCTRAGIAINVFALDIERTQFPFVEQIARVNGGGRSPPRPTRWVAMSWLISCGIAGYSVTPAELPGDRFPAPPARRPRRPRPTVSRPPPHPALAKRHSIP